MIDLSGSQIEVRVPPVVHYMALEIQKTQNQNNCYRGNSVIYL